MSPRIPFDRFRSSPTPDRAHLGLSGRCRRWLGGGSGATILVAVSLGEVLLAGSAWACTPHARETPRPEPSLVFTGVALSGSDTSMNTSEWVFAVVAIERGDPDASVVIGGFAATSGITSTCTRNGPEVGGLYEVRALVPTTPGSKVPSVALPNGRITPVDAARASDTEGRHGLAFAAVAGSLLGGVATAVIIASSRKTRLSPAIGSPGRRCG